MYQEFQYPKQRRLKPQWKIKFEVVGNYRNLVLMKQMEYPIDLGFIPVIGLNPGTFKSESTFGRDTTLRILRDIFVNSGYGIEVLNLYNFIEPNSKKLKLIDNDKRNNSNPIEHRLKRYYPNSKVIVICGKPLDNYTKNRLSEITEIIGKDNIIGMLNKTHEFYYHVIYLRRSKKLAEFKQKVLSELNNSKNKVNFDSFN
jgi:hypothetical protein